MRDHVNTADDFITEVIETLKTIKKISLSTLTLNTEWRTIHEAHPL